MNELQSLISAISQQKIRIVDLTRTLREDTPILPLPSQFKWGESWPFSKEEISRYDSKGPAWYWNNFKCGEHTGTHFDAPIHWVTGKDHPNNATDTLEVEKFFAPAYVIDATEQAKQDPNFLLTVDFIKNWEAEHGQIAENAWFLYRTDWSKKDNDAFLNIQHDGSNTPGWDPDAVRFLAEERNVLGVGTETVGTDSGLAAGQEPAFPCHMWMHGANKCGLAALCNLDQLPPTGAVILAAPLKIENGSGSPARVLALVPG